MTRMTRREFLRTSGAGVGLGLLAAAGAKGCAPSMRGDFAPKAGRRVLVIGGDGAGRRPPSTCASAIPPSR